MQGVVNKLMMEDDCIQDDKLEDHVEDDHDMCPHIMNCYNQYESENPVVMATTLTIIGITANKGITC